MSRYKATQQAADVTPLAMCLLRFVEDRSDPTRLPLGQKAELVMIIGNDVRFPGTTHVFCTPACRAQRSRQLQSHDVTCQSFKPLLGTATNLTVGSTLQHEGFLAA